MRVPSSKSLLRLPGGSLPDLKARLLLALAMSGCMAGTGLSAVYSEVNNPGAFTWKFSNAPWTNGIPTGTDNGTTSSISGLLHGAGTITIDATSTLTTPGSLMVGWQGNYTLNITGGALTVGDSNQEGFAVGESGTGVVTQSGGVVTAAAVRLARGGGSIGTYNLNTGGKLAAALVNKGAGASATFHSWR